MEGQLQNILNDYSEEKLFSLSQADAIEAERVEAPPYSYRREVLKVFLGRKTTILLLLLLLSVLIFSFVYPSVSGYDRYANLLTENSKHLSPAAAMERFGHSIHWLLGTGAQGESTFDAVWNGARISLGLALLCGLINMAIGILVGLIWGFYRKLDPALMAIYHTIGNVPYILVVSVVLLMTGAGFWAMVLALTLTGWLGIAFQIRIQVMIIRDREYNLASIGLGTPTWKIICRNILPHLISVIVTLLAVEIPSYLSYEVFLSYIGIGMSELSLGRLIYEAEPSMFTPGWSWEFWSPVAVACLVTVVLYVTGQRLGDASDPHRHL